MSDAERAIDEEDRLPWLEPVEDEDQRGGAGTGGLVAALVAALVALGLVVGGVFWLRDRGGPVPDAGSGELIAAPAGAYKQKPSEPGGMKVEGQGDAAYAASAGADVNAAIDIAAVPETPVRGAGSATAADAGATEVASAAPPRAKPELAYSDRVAAPIPASGGLIQLGAFSSAAGANSAWKEMSGRFAYLKPLTSSVTAVSAGGKKLYRLRATAGADARTVCGKLKVAGETCAMVNN